MKTESRTVAASLKANPAMVVAALLLVVLLVATIVVYLNVQEGVESDQRYLQEAAELRAQAYQLTSLTRDATSGNEVAFEELQGVMTSMNATWEELRAADPRTREALSDEFSAYGSIWNRI